MDHIIVTGSSLVHVQNQVTELNFLVILKQLENLEYFLGIKVSHQRSGALFLSQTKYIRDPLSRSNLINAKGLSTPMMSNLKYYKHRADYFYDATYYRSIMGAFQYVTIIRSETSYVVNKVCQFLLQPLESHWIAVKRIIKYLKVSLYYGLLLKFASINIPISIKAFSDANWGASPNDRQSTSRSCLYLGPNMVSCWSKKQTFVVISNTEAEYKRLTNTTYEVMWI